MYQIKFRKSDEMKNIDIAWYFKIPADWEGIKGKYVFENRKVKNRGIINEVISLTLNGVIDRDISSNEGLQPKDFSGYQEFKKNDLVFKLIDLENVNTSRVGIVHKDGLMSSAYIRLSKTRNTCEKYFYYLYYSLYIKQIYNNIGNSGVRSAINANDLLNMIVINPSIENQQKIANFLDIKTAQFDSIISKKEKLIEKLEEAKKSQISEVVTGKVKIVNGELVERKPEEMKDSGVEWLGMIPKEWEVKRIKNIFELRNERNYKSMEEVQLLTLYTAKGVRRQEDVESRTGNIVRTVQDYKIVHRNDVIVNIILAWQGAIGYSNYSGVISPAYDIYKPHSYVNSEYYNYLFRTSKFSGECFRYGRGIMLMRWRTYSDEFRSIFVCSPPKREQDKISSFLNNNGIHMQNFIEKNKKQIKKLKQAKQSLISEAVTGKIDLRDWEIQEVDDVL